MAKVFLEGMTVELRSIQEARKEGKNFLGRGHGLYTGPATDSNVPRLRT